eukprot:959785_1
MDVKLILKGDAPEDLIDGNHLKQGDCMINNILEYLGQAAGDMADVHADIDAGRKKALIEFKYWISFPGVPNWVRGHLGIQNAANVTFTECSPGVYAADVHWEGIAGQALTLHIVNGFQAMMDVGLKMAGEVFARENIYATVLKPGPIPAAFLTAIGATSGIGVSALNIGGMDLGTGGDGNG